MDEIVLLPSDHRSAAALIGALDPPHRVTSAGSFSELSSLLKGGRVQGCILDVFDPAPGIPLNALRHLRRQHPGVALIIASDFTGREMELYHLGRLSIDGVIRMEENPGPREIVGVVDRAVAASLATRVVLALGGRLPPLAREVIRWTIEHAEARPQVSAMAAAMAMTPRSLSREVSVMGLGSLRNLLLWGRLIRASHLLGRSGETVESVAFRLGYSSGGALGKALKRHVGVSPTELLTQGGVAVAIQVFRMKAFRAGS